jgi:hypothetical protein
MAAVGLPIANSPLILGVCDGLKVRTFDTVPNVAGVVDLMARRNWPYGKRVHDPMNRLVTTVEVDVPVSVVVQPSCPEKTARAVRNGAC